MIGYNLATNESGRAVLLAPSTVAVERVRSNMHAKSIPTLTPAQIERFWSHVDKTTCPDGCWLWDGHLNSDGYGNVHLAGYGQFKVHRVAYVLAGNALREDMTIDHVWEWGCKHTNCVNPDHLEMVDNATNVMRGNAGGAINIHKTHCIRGHAFDEVNTYIRFHGGGRQCLACTNMRNREYKARQRAKRKAAA